MQHDLATIDTDPCLGHVLERVTRSEDTWTRCYVATEHQPERRLLSWDATRLSDNRHELVTCGPPPTDDTRIGALRDLEPLQDELTNEDIHYWTHGDDEEDKATVCAIIENAEDLEEALKQRLHCGGAYVEEIIDD